jgi:ribosomal protein S21
MPSDQVMHEFKRKTLRSGSGRKVRSRKQAVAILMAEKRREKGEPRRRGKERD